MSISNVKKYNVLEFVEKVRGIAIQTVETKYTKTINEVKELLVSNDPLISKSLLEAKNSLEQARVKIENAIARGKELYKEDVHYYRGLNSILRDIDPNTVDLKKSFLNQFTTQQVTDLEEERGIKVEEVRKAYRAIYDRVHRMSSVKNMREYLDGLGFDTSSLEHHVATKFDKETLFPCRLEEEAKNNESVQAK